MNDAHSTEERINRLTDLLQNSSTKLQVALGVLRGKSRKQIAAHLGRSTHAVDMHLKEIYRSTGIGDRVDLAVLVRQLIDRGLIEER